MPRNLMQLKILLPFKVFAQKQGVSRIVAKTTQGFIGFLPHRLDCAVALTPGILTYEDKTDGEVFIAVDEGILVKTGQDILVSVRGAVGGSNLTTLHEAVRQDFLTEDEQERNIRFALAKLESGFIKRFVELQHG
ncbi:F0F1 ATP synthase subunit epsilon [Sneathiella sp.]|uniref:F0F1 ATP synthase subunit epsilon n=1 Tax=Sneathiella sp. TaxID=1964365 RepID=UPI00356822E7